MILSDWFYPKKVYGNLCRRDDRSPLLRRDFDIRKISEPDPTRTNKLEIEREESEHHLHILQEDWAPDVGLLVASAEKQRQKAGQECKFFWSEQQKFKINFVATKMTGERVLKFMLVCRATPDMCVSVGGNHMGYGRRERE